MEESVLWFRGLTRMDAGTVAVVGLVLSIVGVLSSAVWLLAAIVAAVCGLLFWRTVS